MKSLFKEKFTTFAKKLLQAKNIYPLQNEHEQFDEQVFDEAKTRTVYRFCTAKELVAMQNKQVEQLGSHFINFSRQVNTHHYSPDERYLHFFDSREDAIEVFPQIAREKDYLCSFNIETSTLKHYKGFGYYAPHGYDFDYIKIKEYAIPVSQFNVESLCTSTNINDLFYKNYGTIPPTEAVTSNSAIESDINKPYTVNLDPNSTQNIISANDQNLEQ